MSSDYGHYYAGIIIGFRISIKKINEVFAHTTEGVWHMESRYDPKTGKKVGSEKVWELHPEEYYTLNGIKYDNRDEFFEHLGKSTNSSIYLDELNLGGKEFVYFESDQCTGGAVRAGAGNGTKYLLKQILMSDLESIRESLKDLGLEPPDTTIYFSEFYN
jgi:hypothetical protein